MFLIYFIYAYNHRDLETASLAVKKNIIKLDISTNSSQRHTTCSCLVPLSGISHEYVVPGVHVILSAPTIRDLRGRLSGRPTSQITLSPHYLGFHSCPDGLNRRRPRFTAPHPIHASLSPCQKDHGLALGRYPGVRVSDHAGCWFGSSQASSIFS